MLKTNMKIALRNLYREKAYAAINIAGLSLAITCCLILVLYLRGEITYDQHFEGHENIYRVVNEFTINGQTSPFAYTSRALGKLMAPDFEEIEEYVTMEPARTPIFVSNGEVSNFWPRMLNATPNFFQVFKHDIIYGDPEVVLRDNQSIAVSESFAQFYFGDANPIGEILQNELGDPFVIDLVFADLPENTHLKYDILLSFNRIPIPDDVTVLRNMQFGIRDYTYFKMAEGFDPADFPAMSDAFYERHLTEVGMRGGSQMLIDYSLEPLADIHYYSGMPNDEPQGNPAYLYAFGLVAVFILVIACINYTNLATARSIKRSKEVGLRKILGANKGELMAQFLLEAMLYTLVSTLIAIVLIEILLDTSLVSQLLGKSLSFSLLEEPQLILWLALFTIGVGLLAGLYPAIYLSSWAPLSALVSSGKSAGKSNIKFRQALVLVQFTISIAVIAGTLLMANQMRYISDRSLGFDKENLVAFNMIGANLIEKVPVIKTELMQHPDILGVTESRTLPGQSLPTNTFPIENAVGENVALATLHTDVDTDYLDVMNLELIAGRDFSQLLLTDTGRSAIVNEAMIRRQGWSDDPLGKRIANGRVIGVVKDYNFQSLHTQIEPLVLWPLTNNFENMSDVTRRLERRYLTIKIAGGNVRETLNYLQDRFAEYDPVHNVEFTFVDDHLNQLYQSEESSMRLIGIFAAVCIFIAALGLFGLASFTTEQRSKEIAIRKVLGASTGQIIMLLSRSILILVAVGAVLASVITYLAVGEWLSSFAYRAEISIWSFVVATIAALAVAYLTMALQSYRTAQSDPVNALRTE